VLWDTLLTSFRQLICVSVPVKCLLDKTSHSREDHDLYKPRPATVKDSVFPNKGFLVTLCKFQCFIPKGTCAHLTFYE